MKCNRNYEVLICGEGEDNSTITQMRAQIDAANALAKTKEVELETARQQLKAIQDAELSEAQKLRYALEEKEKEVAKLTPLQEQLENARKENETNKGILLAQYEELVAGIPEDKRAAIKSATHIEGNPIESLSRIKAIISVTDFKPPSQGQITNPGGGGVGKEENKEGTPPNMKQIMRTGWGAILKSNTP
jgi:ribosome-binding ATPase YchF (GTP1/OBG family)